MSREQYEIAVRLFSNRMKALKRDPKIGEEWLKKSGVLNDKGELSERLLAP